MKCTHSTIYTDSDSCKTQTGQRHIHVYILKRLQVFLWSKDNPATNLHFDLLFDHQDNFCANYLIIIYILMF